MMEKSVHFCPPLKSAQILDSSRGASGDEDFLKTSSDANRISSRSNILCFRSGDLIKFIDRARRRIDSESHPTLTMIGLSAVEPQRVRRINLERSGLKGHKTSAVFSDVCGLKASEDPVFEGGAGILEGRLNDGVIFSEEVELDLITKIGGDKRRRVGKTVFADFDKMGDWRRVVTTREGSGVCADGSEKGNESGEIHVLLVWLHKRM